MTDYRRNFIAGGSLLFERLWDVLQSDGFRKGSTHPTGYPHGELHGGGPPQLRYLTVDEARRKYGDNIVAS